MRRKRSRWREPQQVAISYRVATRPPFTKASPERQTVFGGGRFRANWQDLAAILCDLEFPQNNGKISFRAVYGSLPNRRPGSWQGRGFPGVDPASAKFTDPRNVVPQSGHVYLLYPRIGNHWVLFQLEFDEKAPRYRAGREDSPSPTPVTSFILQTPQLIRATIPFELSWRGGTRSTRSGSMAPTGDWAERTSAGVSMNEPPRSERGVLVDGESNRTLDLTVLCFERVLTPLPDVAMEIEQTEIVGLEAAGRLCCIG